MDFYMILFKKFWLRHFMNTKKRTGKINLLLLIMIFFSDTGLANGWSCPENRKDSTISTEHRFLHKVGMEMRPSIVLPEITFMDNDFAVGKPIRNSFSAHLKYSFQPLPNSRDDRIYGGSYQGIGIGYYNFGNSAQMGDPLSVYLFQGGRIVRFNRRVSLNYEWNFGLSFGWNPYHIDDNYYNRTIGSKVNAYLNANFYFNRTLSAGIDLIAGIALTHFSNGNTKYPNAGLNTMGLKIGLVYTLNRNTHSPERSWVQSPVPQFRKHISYDLVMFGSWRRKGVDIGDSQVASPHAYTVLGFNFAPMYNFGYKLRAGLSLDGVYDGSANVYAGDHINGEEEILKPPLMNQLALGLSARAEYIMPYFTVGFGMGANVVHGGGDLKGFYQIISLKVAVTRDLFLHIGYNLKDFRDPNFLMLGVGFRFNNKHPVLRH